MVANYSDKLDGWKLSRLLYFMRRLCFKN